MYSAWPISMAPLVAQTSAVPPSFLIHTFRSLINRLKYMGRVQRVEK